MTKLLFLAGSATKKSLNKKLARHAADIAKSKGAEVTFLDLADYPMPLYCMDSEVENGLPETVVTVKKMFQDHDGFFIASPEFNSSFTPLLKNTLDWISRPHEDGEPMLSAYKGKVAALGAVSPGAMGGLRGLVPLRMMLGNIAVHVTPTQIAVGGKDTFNDAGALTQLAHIKIMDAMMDEFVKTARALNA
jgi:chromate reductase